MPARCQWLLCGSGVSHALFCACALQALLAAELALSGISSFINADEAIDAMKSVGDALPCALKETAGGGMAATPSAIEWAKKYFARK